MTEEEYFRKNYPDACWGDRPLSPYWDYFQDGVEFGERNSEKKITELEEKLANAAYQLEGRENEIKELQEDLRHKKIAIQTRKAIIKGFKKLIDKMKCCGNCKHHRYTYGELECVTKCCKNKDKWELAK